MGADLKYLFVSASLGALIGLIRQWGAQQEGEGSEEDFAGLRTFVLWAVLGHVGALLSDRHSPYLLLAAVGLVGGHLAVSGVFASHHRGTGFTTTASALITLYAGALVYWEHLLLAVVLAALTMLVTGLKRPSHAWTQRFKREDIRSTLQFVAVTGVVLPVVPNEGYGPFGALNPYSLWLMVVLISGLGFVGYLLIRVLGARAGVALAGLVGGLASSTATTLAFSRESKTYPELSGGFALAIVMASTIMLGRVIVLLGVIHPGLVMELWAPFGVLALPGLAYACYIGLFRKAGRERTDIPELKNPLGLSIAIKFALLYGLITLLVKAFSASDLSEGLLALSFVSGLTDMDAIALSVGNNVNEGVVGLEVATRAVILAAIANTLLKGGLAVALGSAELRRHIAVALGCTVAAGAVALAMA